MGNEARLDALVCGNIQQYHGYIVNLNNYELACFVHWLFFDASERYSKIVVARAVHHVKVAIERKTN